MVLRGLVLCQDVGPCLAAKKENLMTFETSEYSMQKSRSLASLEKSEVSSIPALHSTWRRTVELNKGPQVFPLPKPQNL